jgi:hypothetical protein
MTVYVVVIHRGSGEVGGVFHTIQAASDYVTTRPPCNYTISAHVVAAPPHDTLLDQYLSGKVAGVRRQGQGTMHDYLLPVE